MFFFKTEAIHSNPNISEQLKLQEGISQFNSMFNGVDNKQVNFVQLRSQPSNIPETRVRQAVAELSIDMDVELLVQKLKADGFLRNIGVLKFLTVNVLEKYFPTLTLADKVGLCAFVTNF